MHKTPNLPVRLRSFCRCYTRAALLIAVSWALSRHALEAQNPSPAPNDFFKRGTPAIVVGTAGDAIADRAIKAQAVMIRDLLFPEAEILDDVELDTAKGPEAWPANPVLYGGPHVNHVLANLQPSLPFRMERGKIVLGDQVFEGDEYRLIALVPGRPADKDGPGYPDFLLYAGTGSPGVGEINAVRHGAESILVADAFGPLLAGIWQREPDGTMTPAFTAPAARRIAWRTVDRKLKTGRMPKAALIQIRFPQQLPAAEDEEEVIEACLRGLSQAAQKLGGASGADLSIYIYPDLGSIASLTGQRGDGHAVVEARVLHVVRADPAEGGAFEHLLAHEGTHVLAYDTWGPPGTPMLGEGLAVWAAGTYGGLPLEEWATRLEQPPPLANLLGQDFRRLPENVSYPLAGIFFSAAIEELGAAKVRQHLYGATASTWEAACKGAGTTPHELETAFRAKLDRQQ